MIAGLPNGQKKSGKNKKNDKSQVKMGVFEKIQEKILVRKVRIFFLKTSDFVS